MAAGQLERRLRSIVDDDVSGFVAVDQVSVLVYRPLDAFAQLYDFTLTTPSDVFTYLKDSVVSPGISVGVHESPRLDSASK